jgi:uncharacterized protein
MVIAPSPFPKPVCSCEIISVPLVVRPSPIHAVGVFTTTPIRKGARVVEYAGPRITPEEADRRYEGVARTYLYGLEDGKTIIDGEGLGAYLNHSCDPNCEVDEIKGHVWLFALRNIAAGEELVWDYNLYDDDEPAPCHCGSPKCRGTMYSREWMAKMRRREARKKKREAKLSQAGRSEPHQAPAAKGRKNTAHGGKPWVNRTLT